VSFGSTEDIIEKGEEVANNQMVYLKELASKQRNIISKKRKSEYFKKEMLYVNGVTITGNKNYTDEYVLGKLKVDKTGYITFEKFNEGINSLSATGNFDRIRYRFNQNKGGTEIRLKLKENEISTFLQFGVHYDDLYKTGVLLNLTSKHAIFKNDQLSADFILGDNIRYNIDYFIDNGFNISYGINTRFNTFQKSIFENIINDSINPEASFVQAPIKYNDFTTKLFIQTTFSKEMALQVGAEDKFVKISYESLVNNNTDKIFLENTNYLNVFSNLLLDTYDDKDFPKKGIFFFAEYKAYMVSSSFNKEFKPFSQLKGELSGVFTIKNKFTTHIMSEAGITIGDNNRVFNYFLGGNNHNFINNFVSLYGFDVADLNENAFVKSAVTFRYELFKSQYLSFTANAARAEKDLFNQGSIFENTKTGYALGYSLKSPIGPVEVNYSWSPSTNRNYWFFNVGFWF
jgi:NTE family protein